MITKKIKKYLFVYFYFFSRLFLTNSQREENVILNKNEISSDDKSFVSKRTKNIKKSVSKHSFLIKYYNFIVFCCGCVFFLFLFSFFKTKPNLVDFLKIQKKPKTYDLNDTIFKEIDFQEVFKENESVFYINDQNPEKILVIILNKFYKKIRVFNEASFVEIYNINQFDRLPEYSSSFFCVLMYLFGLTDFSLKTTTECLEDYKKNYSTVLKKIKKDFKNKIIGGEEFLELYTDVVNKNYEIVRTEKNQKEKQIFDFDLRLLSDYLNHYKAVSNYGLCYEKPNLYIRYFRHNEQEKNKTLNKIEEKHIFSVLQNFKNSSFFFVPYRAHNSGKVDYLFSSQMEKSFSSDIKTESLQKLFMEKENVVGNYFLKILDSFKNKKRAINIIFRKLSEEQHSKISKSVKTINDVRIEKIDIFSIENIKKTLLNEEEVLQILKKEYPEYIEF